MVSTKAMQRRSSCRPAQIIMAALTCTKTPSARLFKIFSPVLWISMQACKESEVEIG